MKRITVYCTYNMEYPGSVIAKGTTTKIYRNMWQESGCELSHIIQINELMLIVL
jgi:hypothetical protein